MWLCCKMYTNSPVPDCHFAGARILEWDLTEICVRFEWDLREIWVRFRWRREKSLQTHNTPLYVTYLYTAVFYAIIMIIHFFWPRWPYIPFLPLIVRNLNKKSIMIFLFTPVRYAMMHARTQKVDACVQVQCFHQVCCNNKSLASFILYILYFTAA